MPYQIGDTRFPEIPELYQDPQGKQPRILSEAPIGMQHVVNSPLADVCTAWASFSGVSPAVAQDVSWFFERGPFKGTDTELPVERSWFIWSFNGEASGSGCDWGLLYYMNEQGVSRGLGAWWDIQTVGTATEPRGPGYTSTMPMHTALWLPFGGKAQVIGDGVLTINSFNLYALGFHRACLSIPV